MIGVVDATVTNAFIRDTKATRIVCTCNDILFVRRFNHESVGKQFKNL